jgi:hypothetical protein
MGPARSEWIRSNRLELRGVCDVGKGLLCCFPFKHPSQGFCSPREVWILIPCMESLIFPIVFQFRCSRRWCRMSGVIPAVEACRDGVVDSYSQYNWLCSFPIPMIQSFLHIVASEFWNRVEYPFLSNLLVDKNCPRRSGACKMLLRIISWDWSFMYVHPLTVPVLW